MPGYDLEVRADLDEKAYRAKLDKLILYTKTAGGKMEKSLNVQANIVDNASKKIAKIQAEKISPKNVQVDADTAGATAKVAAFNATASAGANSFTSSLITASRAAEQVASRLGTIGIVAGGLGVAVAAGTTGLLTAFGIKFASSIQNSRVGLQGLLGDSSKAADLLTKLKTAADADPFQLDDYAQAAVRFAALSKSTDEIVRNTKLTAALTAQSGNPANFQQIALALAQIGTRGRLAAQEVNQLSNAGVNIRGILGPGLEEAADGSLVLNKNGKLVKITFEDVNKALERSLDPDLIKKFSLTASGRFSVLKSSVQNLTASFVGLDLSAQGIGTAIKGGFLDQLQEGMSAFAKTLDSEEFRGPIQEAGNQLGTAFSALVQQLPTIIAFLGQFLAVSVKITAVMIEMGANILKAFGPQIQSGMKLVSDNAELIAKVLGGLLAGGVLLKIGGAILAIVTPLIGFASTAGPVLQSIFGGIFSAISGLATGIVAIFSGGLFASIGAFFTGIGTAIASVVAQVGLLFAAAGGGFSGFIAVMGGVIAAINPVTAVIAGIVVIIAAVVTALATVDGAFTSVKNSAIKIFNQLKPGFKAIVDGVKDIFSGLVTALKPIGIIVINIFKFIADSGVFEIIGKAIGGIVKAIGVVVKAIGGVIGLLGKIPGFDKIAGAADESGKSADKATKKVKELTDAQKEQVETAKAAFEKTREGYRSLIPPIQDVLKTISEGATPKDISKGIQDQSTLLRSRIENIKTVVASGGGSIVKLASEIGGEAGASFLEKFAVLPPGKRDAAVAQFKKDYAEFLRLQKDVQKTLDDEALAELKAQAQADKLTASNNLTADLSKEVAEFQKKFTPAQLAAIVKKGSQVTSADLNPNGLISSKGGAEKQLKEAQRLAKILDASTQAELAKALGGKAKKDFEGAQGKQAPDVAKETAKQTAKSVEQVFAAEFAKIDLTKGLEKTFREFKDTISNKLKINDRIKDRANIFATDVRAAIDDSLLKHLTFGNPLAALTTAISTAFSTAGGEVAKFRVFLGNSVGALIQSSAGLGQGFAPVATGAAQWFGLAGQQVVKFLVFYSSISGQIFSASTRIGQAIATGIAVGLNNSLGSSLGDTIYRTLADAYNRIAVQVELAILKMRVSLLAAGLFGGGKIVIPQVSFPRLSSGDTDFAGGMARVGERGPENVILPRHSTVLPAHKSKEQLQGNVENNYYDIHGVSWQDAMIRADAEKRARRAMAGL